MNLVDFASIDWSPHSFEDPGGRIFWKEGRLFRALHGRSAKAFLIMEKAGLLERLEEWSVVRTWRADFALPGYEVVVEHEVIPSAPVVSEWSSSMLFDAAMLYCDLSDLLAEHGLQLQDSHGWNIMFRHTQPVYVDFASIVPLGQHEPWMPLYEFINCFLHPLQMIARRQRDHAFYILGTHNWVSVENTIPYLSTIQYSLIRKFKLLKYQRWELIRKIGGPQSVKRLTAILKRELAKLSIPEAMTRWLDYADGFPSPIETSMSGWNEKQRNVYRILCTLNKGQILDLGCNTGWYSLLATHMGFDVISMDMDRMCIDKLYTKAKQNNLKVTPVVGSPFWPSIPHGPRFYQSLQERFRTDHTLMLALAHHLFFKQGYDVKTIVEAVSAMTKKTLILEYIPADDYWVQKWNIPHRIHEWEIDVWIKELKKRFPHIDILPSERSHRSSTVQRLLIVANC
jgi:Tellurite resistance protein TehB